MKSTAKKQTVYYHVTQFGDAANIMKTGQMRGGMISSDERKTHLRAGLSTRGYYISLARSLSSHYVAYNMKRGGETFCVLMIDTDRIRGRFRLAPVNYANFERAYSEYEERLISDTEYIDVSNAVVGIVLLARMESKKYIVRIPRKFFPFCKGRELFYVTLKNIAAKRPLNLKIAAGHTTLTETKRYVAPSKISHSRFGVLTTPLDNVPELPPSDLVNYARLCVDMLDTGSQVYQNKQVYDYVASLAVRKKVQPEVVIRSMLDVSRAALKKRANSIFKEYVVDFADAVKKARRLQYADEAFSEKAFELGALAQVFQQSGLVKQSGIFEGLHEVYSRMKRVVKRNSPREMAKLSRSTSKLELERGLLSDFHDDHEFDLESLKDFVFAKSPNLRERLAPYIDELYRN